MPQMNMGVIKPRMAFMLVYLAKHCKLGKGRSIQALPAENLQEPLTNLLSQCALISIADISAVPKTITKLAPIKDSATISAIHSCIAALEQTQKMTIDELASFVYIPNTATKRLLQIGAQGFAQHLSKPVCEQARLPLSATQ